MIEQDGWRGCPSSRVCGEATFIRGWSYSNLKNNTWIKKTFKGLITLLSRGRDASDYF